MSYRRGAVQAGEPKLVRLAGAFAGFLEEVGRLVIRPLERQEIRGEVVGFLLGEPEVRHDRVAGVVPRVAQPVVQP